MSNRDLFRATALAAAVSAAGVMPAFGYEYQQGDFRIQVDSTLSLGASWRASDRDYRNVGLVNAKFASDNLSGATHYHGSSTADDGNLFWKKGATFSELAKLTIDLEMNYQNYGAFIRGKAFYDHRLVNGDGVTDLPAYYWGQDTEGSNTVPNQSDGRSADILDAFIWADWYVGDKPLNVRLGKQVISWGEGLLFANGINSINPIDVGALLAPGSEVKDALIPLNALYASLGLTESLTIEGFALLEWRETELPACGSFFSVSDLVGSSCNAGFIPSGSESSAPAIFSPEYGINIPFAANQMTLPRGADVEPDGSGQYGIAARYFADSIETELSVYYMNFHSRLPVTSGHFPDVTKLGFSTLADARLAFTTAVTPGYPNGNPLATIALLPYGDYFVEYPEDIQLLGISLNTTADFGLPGGATAVSGELSMRHDQPFAREDGDALAGASGLPSLGCFDAQISYDCYSKFEPGEYNKGYVQSDYFQAEMVFIHFFDQVLGASRWTAVLDIAGSYIDLPSKSEALLNSNYNATLNHPWVPSTPYTVNGHPVYGAIPFPLFIEGAWNASVAAGFPVLTVAPEDRYFPTSGAWGYKLRLAGEYNNVFAGVNLRPVISFSHDVYGTTPTPIANFLEGRKALGLSLEGVVLNDYSVKLVYTDFYGAEPYNSLADRDYYSVSATASF